jgi:hypothetical protein
VIFGLPFSYVGDQMNRERYNDSTADIAIAHVTKEEKRKKKWRRNGRQHSTTVKPGIRSGLDTLHIGDQ